MIFPVIGTGSKEPVRLSKLEVEILGEALARARRREAALHAPEAKIQARRDAHRAIRMLWPDMPEGAFVESSPAHEVSENFVSCYPILRKSATVGYMFPPLPPQLGNPRIVV
jgi:hypothetical protein